MCVCFVVGDFVLWCVDGFIVEVIEDYICEYMIVFVVVMDDL